MSAFASVDEDGSRSPYSRSPGRTTARDGALRPGDRAGAHPAGGTAPLRVVALIRDATRRHRLERAALAPGPWSRLEVMFAADWRELRSVVRAGAALAVVNPVIDGPESLANCRELLRAFPSTPVVLYGPQGFLELREVLELVREGAQDAIGAGGDLDSWLFRSRIEEAIDAHLAIRVVQALPPHVPRDIRDTVRHIVRHATDTAMTVASVAALRGWHANTLARRLALAGLVPPGHLLIWARLVRASMLLSDPSQTVETVAQRLGFGDASGLSHAMRRWAGLSVREVMRQGGMTVLLPLCQRRDRGSGSPRTAL